MNTNADSQNSVSILVGCVMAQMIADLEKMKTKNFVVKINVVTKNFDV